MDNYVAFIPVRGGSKSIPLKNIKEISGRPLVYWTIDAAVGCPNIDRVYVSTDSDRIKSAVESYINENGTGDKLVCIGRSAETANDTASTESAMLEFAGNYDFEHIKVYVDGYRKGKDRCRTISFWCIYRMDGEFFDDYFVID